MDNEIQGVVSLIEFPLGQDEVAVDKAIKDLLSEGWHFSRLTKTHIGFCREWEVDLNSRNGGSEVIYEYKELQKGNNAKQ